MKKDKNKYKNFKIFSIRILLKLRNSLYQPKNLFLNVRFVFTTKANITIATNKARIPLINTPWLSAGILNPVPPSFSTTSVVV